MATRDHDHDGPGCKTCNPEGTSETPEMCNCIEDGYKEGLVRWQKACSCCFSEAYPQGLEAALAEVKG